MNESFCNATNGASPTNSSSFTNHNLDDAFTIVLATFVIFIMIGGVVFNVMLVYTICRNKALHTIKNYLIVNLATCDLLRAIATLPFEPDYLLRGYFHFGVYLCGWKEIIFILSLPLSIINVMLLTAERLFILLYPFQYRRMFTKENLIGMLFFVWLYVIIVAAYPIMINNNAVCARNGYCFVDFSNNYGLFLVFGNFACPLLLIVVMNYCIFCVASKAIQRRRNWSANSDSQHQFFTNYKAAKTVFIIVANVTLCWLTYIIIVAMNFLCGAPCFSLYVTYIGKVVNSTSVASNPILYGLLNKSIRKFIANGCRVVSSHFCGRKSDDAGDDPSPNVFQRLTYLKKGHHDSAGSISLTRVSIC